MSEPKKPKFNLRLTEIKVVPLDDPDDVHVYHPPWDDLPGVARKGLGLVEEAVESAGGEVEIAPDDSDA